MKLKTNALSTSRTLSFGSTKFKNNLSNNRLIISLLFGFHFCFVTITFGQIDKYDYQRPINGINNQWHQITLPETIFEKVNLNFSDLRIYGITAEKDTIEASYLLKIGTATTETKSTNFKLINKSLTKDGHYFTFELSNETAINQIKLNFKQQNFDWKIRLEGSQNQRDWFTIKDDYRIVSIKNSLTDYQFTSLQFPPAKYHFYRLLVKTSHVVTLNKSQLDLQKTIPANYQDYSVVDQKISNNKTQKTTELEFELERPLPISFVKIKVDDDFDYYRPMNIQYARDSVQTEKGWRYQYVNIHRSILSSLDEHEFTFKSTIAKKFKVIIQKQDNPPLNIDAVFVKGYQHQLIARFTQPAEYFLTYGRKNARKPRYDIAQFSATIPTDLGDLSLGNEQLISKIDIPKTSPLFANKWWLWGLMVVIILVLGSFTFKMLKEV